MTTLPASAADVAVVEDMLTAAFNKDTRRLEALHRAHPAAFQAGAPDALHPAVFFADPTVALSLLAHGADPTRAASWEALPPIDHAAAAAPAVFHAMLARGFRPTAGALHLMLAHGAPLDRLKPVIEAVTTADLVRRDVDGFTLVEQAARLGRADVAEAVATELHWRERAAFTTAALRASSLVAAPSTRRVKTDPSDGQAQDAHLLAALAAVLVGREIKEPWGKPADRSLHLTNPVAGHIVRFLG
jgi:hypothetical protein